tara:strand:- start:441 stop:1520 length:1080 start_codon:yes stop_codon:yes gene_type:complete
MRKFLKNKSILGLLIIFWGLIDFILYRLGIDLYGMIGIKLSSQNYIFSHLYAILFGLTYIYTFSKNPDTASQSEIGEIAKKYKGQNQIKKIIFIFFFEVPKFFLNEIKKYINVSINWFANNWRKILSNFLTLIYALIIALLIRTFLLQPFFIPSSSMEPGLLVGDRLFASKYDYGYSKHSFPFSRGPISDRILANNPQRGDVIIFKPPHTNLDYIKRLVGLPGDKIVIQGGKLFINGETAIYEEVREDLKILKNGRGIRVQVLTETLPNGKTYEIYNYQNNSPGDNTKEFIVPENHYFFLGDNRDNSNDSRFWGSVDIERIVGKAQIIFFATKRGTPMYNLILKRPFEIDFTRIMSFIY